MEQRIHTCLVCLRHTTLTCECCQAVYYCSKECQTTDFKYHKYEVDINSYTTSRFSADSGVMDVEVAPTHGELPSTRRKLKLKESASNHVKKMNDLRQELRLYEEAMKKAKSNNGGGGGNTNSYNELKQAFIAHTIRESQKKASEEGSRHLKQLKSIAEIFKKPFDEAIIMNEFYTEFIRRKQELAFNYVIATMKSDQVRLSALHKESVSLQKHYVQKAYHEWLLKDMVLSSPDKEKPHQISLSDILRKTTREMDSTPIENTVDGLFDAAIYKESERLSKLFSKPSSSSSKTQFKKKRSVEEDIEVGIDKEEGDGGSGDEHRQYKPSFRASSSTPINNLSHFNAGRGKKKNEDNGGGDKGAEKIITPKKRGRKPNPKKQEDEAEKEEEVNNTPYTESDQGDTIREAEKELDRVSVGEIENIHSGENNVGEEEEELDAKVDNLVEGIIKQAERTLTSTTDLLVDVDGKKIVDKEKCHSYIQQLVAKFLPKTNDPSFTRIISAETNKISKLKAAGKFVLYGSILPLLIMFALRQVSAPLGEPASIEDIHNAHHEQTEIIREYAETITNMTNQEMEGIFNVTREWTERTAQANLCNTVIQEVYPIEGTVPLLMIDSGGGSADEKRESFGIIVESMKYISENLADKTGEAGYKIGQAIADMNFYARTGDPGYLDAATTAFDTLRTTLSTSNVGGLSIDICDAVNIFRKIEYSVINVATKLRGFNLKLVEDMNKVGAKYTMATEAYEKAVKTYRFVKAPYVQSWVEHFKQESLLSPNLVGASYDAWAINNVGAGIWGRSIQMAMSIEETTNTLFKTLWTDGDIAGFFNALFNDNLHSIIRLSDLTTLVYISMGCTTFLGYVLKYVPFLATVGATMGSYYVSDTIPGAIGGALFGGLAGGAIHYTVGPVKEFVLSVMKSVNSLAVDPVDNEMHAIVREFRTSKKPKDVLMQEAVERIRNIAPHKETSAIIEGITKALEIGSVTPLQDWVVKIIDSITAIPDALIRQGTNQYILEVLYYFKLAANSIWLYNNYAMLKSYISGVKVMETVTRFFDIVPKLMTSMGVGIEELGTFVKSNPYYVAVGVFGAMFLYLVIKKTRVGMTAIEYTRPAIKLYMWALWRNPLLTFTATTAILTSFNSILIPVTWSGSKILLDGISGAIGGLSHTAYLGDSPNIFNYQASLSNLRNNLITHTPSMLNDIGLAKEDAIGVLYNIYKEEEIVKAITHNTVLQTFPMIREVMNHGFVNPQLTF